jgi:SAM-dependent methyltransferase
MSGLPPAPWLTDHHALLPAGGDALDVACGHGRHALWLAGRGFRTLAVDRDAGAVEMVRRAAADEGLPLAAEVRDLEGAAVDLPARRFSVIVVVHYLHRPLMPTLIEAVAPGGVLVYETFTRAQAARGRPTNPAFLLEPGELPQLVAPLEVLRTREGDFDGRWVASVVARRPVAA